MVTLVHISFTISILILVIVILRGLFLKKLPNRTFLILWGITIIRLLFPMEMQSQYNLFTMIEQISSFVEVDNEIDLQVENLSRSRLYQEFGTLEQMDGLQPTFLERDKRVQNLVKNDNIPLATDVVNSEQQLLMIFLTIIWVIGGIATAFIFVASHIKYSLKYRSALPSKNAFVLQWVKAHPMKRNVIIKQSDRIITPFTYGVWRPVVILPKRLENVSELELQFVLEHEFIHIRHFDIVFKWMLAVTACIYWFHPLVWVMYVLANRDIENSCDESVIYYFGEAKKSAYALTLISLEEKKMGFQFVGNHFSKNATEERIKFIMKIRKLTLGRVLFALVLVVGIATVFATTAGANQESESENAGKASKEGIFNEGKTTNGEDFKENGSEINSNENSQIGNLAQTTNKIGQNGYEFPILYQDDSKEHITFNTTIVVDENVLKNGLYHTTAKLIEYDTTKFEDYFTKDKKVLEYKGEEKKVREEFGLTEKDGPFSFEDGSSLSVSTQKVLYLTQQSHYIRGGFNVQNEASEYLTGEDLEFATSKESFQKVKKDFLALGLDIGENYQFYTLDHEFLADNEYVFDINGNLIEEDYKEEWTKEDDAYYFTVHQYLQDCIVQYPLAGSYQEVADENAPIQFTVDKNGLNHVEFYDFFTFNTSEKKIELVPFDTVVETINRFYKPNDEYVIEVTDAQLFMRPMKVNGIDYDVIPMWEVTFISQMGEDKLEIERYINAITGEEVLLPIFEPDRVENQLSEEEMEAVIMGFAPE